MSESFTISVLKLAGMAPLMFAALAIAVVPSRARRYESVPATTLPAFNIAWKALASKAVDALAFLICVGFAASMILYLVSPGYLDHLEPLMAATAYMSLKGLPLYPAWSDGLYGDLYGPFGYQLLSLGLLAKPTIAGSKIVTLLCTAAAFLFQYAAFRRISPDKTRSLRLIALAVIVSSNTVYLLSNRPDPILFLLASLGIYSLGTDGRLARALLIGAAAGLAADLKAHGCLYLAPAAAALVAMQPEGARRILCVLLGVGTALVAALAPFALPGASLSGYWTYLEPAAGHGLVAFQLLENMEFWSLLVTLPGIAYFALRPRLAKADQVLLVTLAASSALVSVIASKAGSGVHHLYPFIPSAIYGLGRILTAARDENPRFAPGTVLALLFALVTVTLGLSGALKITEDVASMLQTSRAEDAKLAEIASLAKTYPRAEMGVTDDEHYADTFLSPLLVFSGHGLHFNAAAWMDLKQDNVNERYAAALFGECRIPVWILPSQGAPFTLPSYYSWRPLFSPQFRALFAANYRLIKHGGFYNVWACKRPETAAGIGVPA